MKRNIIYIVVGIIVAVLMGIFFYHGEEKSTPPSHVTDNGAEIEVPEGAVGFGCSCGCQDEGGDGVCRCENCDMHEDKEEVKEPEVIYFENPDENDEAAFVHTKDLTVEPLTEEKRPEPVTPPEKETPQKKKKRKKKKRKKFFIS